MTKSKFLRWVLPALIALLVGGMAVQLTSCDTGNGSDGGNGPGGEVPGGGPGGEVPGGGPGGEVPGGGPGGYTPGGNTPGGVVENIKFDLTGATAILVAEGSSEGRAVSPQDNNILFKVLVDNKVEPIFDFSSIPNSTPPKVKFIARSPVAGKKDLYICFEQNWEYWKEGYWSEENEKWVDGERVSIGSFIHVKEDGAIYSIVWNEENSNSYVTASQNNDAVAFDQQGNLYFTVSNENWGSYSSTSTSVIYKYDPAASKRTSLTAAVTGTYYENVQLSADGVYIIVKGRRWDNNTGVGFLRLIPTATPDMTTNIFYRTGGNSDIRSFALNPRTMDVYLSGNEVYNDGSGNYAGGFYKVSINGTSQSNMKWTPLFTYSYGKPQFVSFSQSYVDGYTDDDGSWVNGYYKQTYSWKTEYCDKDGNPDYAMMMEALYGYFLSDNIEFRHPSDDSSLKNIDALKDLNDQNKLELIGYDSSYYNSPTNGASDYCYSTRTNTKATRIENYSFDYMETLLIGSNNSVWGIPSSWNNGKKVLTQLIDKDGKRDFYIPESMKNRVITSVKPTASYVYFCADVSLSGIESGYQNVFRFNYDTPETVQNMFEGIRSRDKAYMEVFSYAVSGNYLYFGGTQGTSLLAGKIDLTTNGYIELEFGKKITAMVSY